MKNNTVTFFCQHEIRLTRLAIEAYLISQERKSAVNLNKHLLGGEN